MKKPGALFILLLLFTISASAESYIYKYKIVFSRSFSSKVKDATDHLRNFTHAFSFDTDPDGFYMVIETFNKIDNNKLEGKMLKLNFPLLKIMLTGQVSITDEQRQKLEELHRQQEIERIASGK